MDEGFVDEWSVGFMEKLSIISWDFLKNYPIFPIYSKKLQVIYTLNIHLTHVIHENNR
jgi:hypothetical protein